MSPTSGMYHSRPTDLIVRRISVGLENAFELSQKPLWSIPSATQAEIEYHAPSGATVLPEVCLMVLASALACLHIDWGFIGLYVSSGDQLSPHFQAEVPFQNHALSMQGRVIAIFADYRFDDDAVAGQALLDDPWRQRC